MHTIKNVVIILIIIIIIIVICMLLIESKKNIIERLSCPIGEQEGTGQDAGTCEKCPPGTFKTKTMSTCAPPDAGHFALYDSGDTIKTGSVEQVPCAQYTEDKRLTPYYSRYTHSANGAALANDARVLANVGKCSSCPLATQSVCKPCPPGTSESWNRGNLTCVPCPSGTYRTSSMDKCKAPDVRHHVVYDTTNTDQTGSVEQAACQAGYLSSDNITCTACPIGTFRTLTMDTCRTPDPGHFAVYESANTSKTGSMAQNLCSTGTQDKRITNYTPRLSRGLNTWNGGLFATLAEAKENVGKCSSCPAGLTTCDPCPAGSELDADGTTCRLCPIGTFRTAAMGACRTPSYGHYAVTATGAEYTKIGSEAEALCATGTVDRRAVLDYATPNVGEASRSYSSVWKNSAPGSGQARSRLDSKGAWSAAVAHPTSPTQQWIQLNLGSIKSVVGVMTQARAAPHSFQFVKSYFVEHSLTGLEGSWTLIPGTSTGNNWTDLARDKKVPFYFLNPVSAQYIKISPTDVHVHTSMRVDLILSYLPNRFNFSYGKSVWTDQSHALVPNSMRTYSRYPLNHWKGMESGKVWSMIDSPSFQVYSNSFRRGWITPFPVLNTPGAYEWMQFNLGSVQLVSGVVSQGLKKGHPSRLPMLVKSFRVEHSLTPMNEGITGTAIPGTGGNAGNTNTDTKEYFIFPEPVSAQYIKIYVLSHLGTYPRRPAMRADVLLTNSNSAGFRNVGSCEKLAKHKSAPALNSGLGTQGNNTLLDAIWKGGNADLFNIVLPEFVKKAGFSDINAKVSFQGGGISGRVETLIKTITDTIKASVATATAEFQQINSEISAQVQQLATATQQIADLNNLGTSAADSVQELTTLLNKASKYVQDTLTLLDNITTESKTFADKIIECIISIFTNISTILHTLFNVDIPKFKGDEYTLTPKINLIGIRTKHMFSKLGSLIISFSVFILIIAENRGIFEFGKISKFIITNLLIDTWKFIQYTIKYNLIDLLSTKPPLKNIISKKVYKDSINAITFRLLEITRGAIHFSEIFITLGFHILDLVDLLLDTVKFIDDFIKGGSTPIDTGTIIGSIKKEIENMLTKLNPFGGADFSLFTALAVPAKYADDGSAKTVHRVANDAIRATLTQINTLINTTLKPNVAKISSAVIQCTNGDTLTDFDKDGNPRVDASGNHYCQLEFIPSIKNNINKIDNVINKSQEDLYLNLYNVSIDISKPFGWSYDENKKDIEEKIDIKKM